MRSSQNAGKANFRLCEVAFVGHYPQSARHGSTGREFFHLGVHVSLCPNSSECLEGKFLELRLYGSKKFVYSSQNVSKKGQKRRTATQNPSGIHRVLVLMSICTRIRALREKVRTIERRRP
jgi:hypothetical protein